MREQRSVWNCFLPVLWAVSALILCLLVFKFVDLEPRVDENFFFSGDDPQVEEDQELAKTFPEKSELLLASVIGDIRSGEYRKRVRALTQALLKIRNVDDVKSITRGPDDMKDAYESPLWSRFLISEDRRSTNLIILLGGRSFRKTIAAIEKTAKTSDADDFRIRMSGVPYVVELIRRYLVKDFKTFTLAALMLFGVAVSIVFRSAAILAGAFVTCLASSAAALLVTGLLNIKVGLLTANLATIVFVMTLSHVVFMTNNWRRLAIEHSLAARQRALRAARVTLHPSLWCMITTMLSFVSLSYAQAKPIRELGISGSIGAGLAIVIAYLVYPSFLAIASKSAGHVRRGEDPPGRFGHGTHGWLVLAVLILCAWAWTGLKRLDTDPSLLSYFNEKGDLREGLEYIDKNGGSSPIRIGLGDLAGEKLNTREAYKRLWNFQKDLERDPDVGTVLSLPVVLAEARREPLAFIFSWEGLIRQLEETGEDSFVKKFITRDRMHCYFMLRMKESNRKAGRLEVAGRIRRLAHSHGFEPAPIGGLYILQGHLAQLVSSSLVFGLRNLIVIFLAIAFFVSRSLRTSLAMLASLGVVPLCILGTAGHMNVPIDVISAPASNIAIGMGIDSMIHLVFAARRARQMGTEAANAWDEAKSRMWLAVLGNAFIVAGGFGIFNLSTFPPTRRFGTAVLAGAAIAALTALVVLPYLAGRPLHKILPRRIKSRIARIVVFAFFPAALSGLAGCGKDGALDGRAGLTIAAGGTWSEMELLERQIEAFDKAYPGSRTRIIRLPPSSSQQHDVFVTYLSARDPTIDVLNLDVVWIAEFAAAGWLHTLEAFWPGRDRKQFIAETVQACTYDSNVYAVPWFTSCGLLYYRRDVLNRFNLRVPSSLEDLQRCIETVRRTERHWTGFLWQAAQYEGLVCNFYEAVWSSPDMATALKKMSRLVQSGTTPRSVLAFKEEDVRRLFARGDVLFMRNWPYAWSLLNDEKSPLRGKVGIAELPWASPGFKGVSCLGGWNLAISRFSRDPQRAWKLVQFLTSPDEMLEKCLITGELPARADLLEHQDLAAKHPQWDRIKQILRDARARPVTAFYSRWSRTVQLECSRFLTNLTQSAEATADSLEQSWNKLDRLEDKRVEN